VGVADVDPQPAVASLAAIGILDRDRRVVGMDDLAREDVGGEVAGDRREEICGNRHPVAQGLAREGDAVPGEEVDLAIERQMSGAGELPPTPS
jgi:hypothetical protein